jgi:1,4-alpha-glucan branching enzyme
MPTVTFEYLTGLEQRFIMAARLTGSWDAAGHPTDRWSSVPMEEFTAEDGCPAFRASVNFDDAAVDREFRWGVVAATQQQPDAWGIPTEVNNAQSNDRSLGFTLGGTGQTERYYLTYCRRMGANKLFLDGGEPSVRFAVWAPNATDVRVVRGGVEGPNSEGRQGVFIVEQMRGGYIGDVPAGADAGEGEVAAFPMRRGSDGVWVTDVADAPELRRFAGWDHVPYMYKVTKDDGQIAYRTDLYSRCQIGSGGTDPADPETGNWSGLCVNLDGSKSCSVVVDPERIVTPFLELDRDGNRVFPETQRSSTADFWSDEYRDDRPVPTRIEDLVIYELHVDGLKLNGGDRGTLDDARNMLFPYLRDLGINAIELMPMSEFQARLGWGYSTSHYMAIEYAGGGRDQFKHFVHECHRNGFAVILDVVYNHYTFREERAEGQYDSNAPDRNIYYWYEGQPSQYQNPNDGYLQNGSSGRAPNFRAEMVRRMFTSRAAALVSEFHFDGFRVDLTQAIHRDNRLEGGDRRGVPEANAFGIKFLREWSNTIRLIKPTAFLIAEDHSGWDLVTQPTTGNSPGLGFDVRWYADFYHHLIGDANNDGSRAHLIKYAGYGDNRALAMTWFAGALLGGADQHVVYHESHDEAGNSHYNDNGVEVYSARTIAVAVNNASLAAAETRRYAENRVHFAAGMTLLGPGIPMFFMGEEVGAWERYTYDNFSAARQNFQDMRETFGANLFRFYADLVHLRLTHPALRSPNTELVHVHDANRVIAFRRAAVGEDMLVVGSLNNTAFDAGYQIRDSRIADGQWREVFNSDYPEYGGGGLTNASPVTSSGGMLTMNLPANSVVVLQRA